MVPTGVALAIPEGFAGFVLPRSGLALRHGLTVVNAPGLIDAGYRDEVKVILLNTDPEHEHRVLRGERIAQLVIQRVETRLAWSRSRRCPAAAGAVGSATPVPDPWRPVVIGARRPPARRPQGPCRRAASRKLAWRTRPSLVHSAKAISATSTGFTRVASRA